MYIAYIIIDCDWGTLMVLALHMTAPKPTPGKMKKLLPCPGLNSLPL